MKKQRTNGITLIALVITIIVLLILAGVTIASITGENGILGKAQSTKTKTDLKAAEEKVKKAIMAARSNDGTLAIDNLRTEIENEGGTLGDETDFPVTATVDGKTFTIDQNGNVESAGARPQLTEIKVTKNGELFVTEITANGTYTFTVKGDGNIKYTLDKAIYFFIKTINCRNITKT